MLFVKRRRILVTCSRRLENPAGLRLCPPFLFFLGFWNFSDANEGWGTSQPLYKGWGAGRPAAGRPGPAPRCWAAWEAGRPAAGRPAPRDLCVIFSVNFFFTKAPGYIPVNFQIENIFL